VSRPLKHYARQKAHERKCKQAISITVKFNHNFPVKEQVDDWHRSSDCSEVERCLLFLNEPGCFQKLVYYINIIFLNKCVLLVSNYMSLSLIIHFHLVIPLVLILFHFYYTLVSPHADDYEFGNAGRFWITLQFVTS
jgi:hypothetical protein